MVHFFLKKCFLKTDNLKCHLNITFILANSDKLQFKISFVCPLMTVTCIILVYVFLKTCLSVKIVVLHNREKKIPKKNTHTPLGYFSREHSMFYKDF